jgi:hypothetical protein
MVALDPHTQRKDILERIDPATNRTLATIQAHGDIQAPIAISGQDVWASADEGSGAACNVIRVNAQVNRLQGILQASGCQGMLQSAGSIWLVNGPSGSITPVTPAP